LTTGYKKTLAAIAEKKELTEEIEKELKKAIEEYKKTVDYLTK
jgi:F0F1-type ATP synthase alpha subunit